jgi:hypothetical protein
MDVRAIAFGLLHDLSRPTPLEVDAASRLAHADPHALQHLALLSDERGVGGLVFRHLETHGMLARLPARDVDALRHSYRATLAQNLRRLAAIDEILDAFRERGIEPAPLKGVWLLETHYPDPGTRPMRDIDLLVREDQLAAAETELGRLGYRRRTTAGRARSEDAYYQRSYVRGAAPADERVELHQSLCDPHRYAVRIEELWDRSIPALFRARTVRLLDPADHLAYLALHAALHVFLLPLTPIVDIGAVIRSSPDLLDAAVLRAQSWRAGAAIHLAFTLARDLCGAPIPEIALRRIAPRGIRALGLRACFRTDDMPAFRWRAGFRAAQLLTLWPLLDSGHAAFLWHYARLRAADALEARRPPGT